MKAAENGNVFFYILVAIALFAALSYAISQSGRGNISAVTGEKAKLAATEIIEYGHILASAAGQLRLRSYADTALSFDNNIVGGYANGACAESACEIFGADGAGIIYKSPMKDWLDATQSAEAGYGDWFFTGSLAVEEIGTAQNDLAVLLPYVGAEICAQINQMLSVEEDAPEDGVSDYTSVKFTGSYATSKGVIGDAAAKLAGKSAGCFKAAAASGVAVGSYHYYQVLVAR